ncbi:hypothetical protein B1813_22860 [Saccharomonospora piscinae]|uniref:TrwC relaxase domain-containing protein n=2 Tax=Saccharomonospora piscinae TaxID=687388 RepID=A0A1V8ZW53_SACPI|nr:hypothetical protein B1813_22860 [Saccharomonospora piscinae]
MTGHPGAAEYLWEAQACAESRELDEAELAATRGDSAAYYSAAAEQGEAPGRMAGAQLRHLGLRDGEVPDRDTALRLLRCLDPETGDPLGRALRTPPPRDQRLRAALQAAGDVSEEEAAAIARRIDKTGRGGVGFYDLTFSASKSVSVYYALLREAGEHELAAAVLSAHDDATHYAMTYAEEHTWSRVGSHGRAAGASTGRMERVTGLVRLHFQHSTSRGRDPHLHTHVGVMNRVRCADGRWRAVHGAAWKPVKAAVAARYEARLAELIEQRTPARMAVREDGKAREIIGLDEAITEASSQRSEQVAAARERYLTEFRERNGREPSPRELRRIDRLAGLESRARKSAAGPAQQYREWAQRIGVDPAEQVGAIHAAGQAADFWRSLPEVAEVEAAAVQEALAQVQAESSTWSVGELTSVISLHLPPGLVERAAELARQACADGNSYGVVDLTRRDVPATPEDLLDERQRPVWRDPALDGARYALADHLSAESQLVAAARTHTVAPWTTAELDALRAQWSRAGDTISEQQAEAVCAVLASPRAGDVLIAAAGTGKSYLAGRLAAAWQSRGGVVIGTATSQIATSVLAAETGSAALNTTRLLQTYGPDHPGAAHRLPAGALILLDEANMTSTEQLRRVQEIAHRDGAKVLYFGDPAQLGAVGAGGGLDLMAAELGTVADLDEVRRFGAEWEREASTRLRAGDLSCLDDYQRHGRLHGGTREAMVSAAVDRYVAARMRGQSAALVTATNAEAAEVSALVQERLLALGYREPGAIGARLVGTGLDGNDVRVGDRIQWRQNVYDVRSANGAPLVNREFLTVVDDGLEGVTLRRESDGSHVTVPHEWLPERAQLGYAGTEHAYEGVTVDVAHTLTAGYVAMTRGREVNEAWLTTIETGDHHGEAVQTTVRDVFEQRFSEEGQALAALQVWREEIDAERHTATLSAAWQQTTELVVRDATMDAIGAYLGWDAADRVSTEHGLQRLQSALTRAALRGYDYDRVLREAIESRTLDRVDDLAAVLAYRVQRVVADTAPEGHPQSWADRAAAWGDRGQQTKFLARVGRLWDERVTELGQRVLAQPPQWALAQLGAPPEDTAQRQEWTLRAGRIAAYREQCGISDALPSLGARPHDEDLAQQAAWTDAALAAGRPVDEAEYHALPDSDLDAMRARWRRLTAAAPTYVEPELGRAHDAHRRAAADAVLLRSMAEHAEPADRASLLDRAATLDREAEVSAQRAEMLSELHQVRAEWMAAHEADQDAAVEAERELKRRGRVLDVEEEPEQGELFGLELDVEAPDVECEAEGGAVVCAREQVHVQRAHTTAEADRAELADVEPGAVDRQAEAERDAAQARLFDAPVAAADVARQQPVVMALDEDSAADQVHSQAREAWEAHRRAEAERQTLAEARTRARYAEEMLQRRAEERALRAAQAEAERQERAARDEVERGGEVAERDRGGGEEVELF